MTMRTLQASLIVLVLATSATAQFTVTSGQNRIGDSGSLFFANGFPNSMVVVCIDTDPGPVFFPSIGLTVDLGFSSNFIAFEPAFLDGTGSGSMGFLYTETSTAGLPYYAQALNVDPLDVTNIMPSNQYEAVIHHDDVSGGTVTNHVLADDGSVQVALGFSFEFFGTTYTQVYINANGNLTFGTANAAFFADESLFIGGPPCIAPFWTDFNPSLGGTISSDTTTMPGQALVVRWSSVAHNLSGNSTCSVTLWADGDITFDYGAVNSTGFIAGITPGGSATLNAVDLDAGGFEFHGTPLSVYEVFPGAFDAEGTIVSFGHSSSGYLLFY